MDTGVRNVVISIIENIQPADRAADLIIDLFERKTEPEPVEAAAPRRARKKRASKALGPDEPLDPDELYSLDVVSERTGYAKSTLFAMMRDHPERLPSQKKGRNVVVFGKDILTLAKSRGRDETPSNVRALAS